MEAYRHVDVSDLCYLDEAVLWLALGRLPERMTDDQDCEVRLNMDAHVDGWEVRGFSHFTPQEFKAAGVEVDYDRYVEARLNWPAYGTVSQYRRSRGDLPVEEDAVAELSYVERMEGQFTPYLELAKVQLLAAVMEGRLSAEAVRCPASMSSADAAYALYRKYDGIAGDVRMASVPETAWRVKHVQWNRRRLQSGPVGYCFITFQFPALIALFPHPNLPMASASGDKFGDTVSVKQPERARKRGGPRKGRGKIEEAVLKEFSERLDRGELPVKREAILQEVREFCQIRFDEEIGRTTARRYVEPVLKRMSRKTVQK